MNSMPQSLKCLVMSCLAAGLFTVRLAPAAALDLGDVGPQAKWERIEIALTGPESQGRGTPNPFAIAVDGVFTAPSGKEWVVPGFYDGDGKGGLDGSIWKVRFSADELGQWSFRTRSPLSQLDGRTGSFRVTPPPADAPGLYRLGRLEAVGTAQNKLRYLKFRDGPYWLKAGCDDPENFLGEYGSYDTLEKRRASIDYLAERGINSLYVMSHNLDGDDRDVWPWLGQTPREAKANGGPSSRFDVAKLEAWRFVLEHMQRRGLVVYLVLEDDSAWQGYDHARYYREMVARFGYLPGLLFNLGEEHNENYTLAAALGHMRQLAAIDPYDHPRGIHNVNTPTDQYIDAEEIDFTSIQTGSPGTRRGVKDALAHHQLAIDWLKRCESRGQRMLVVNFDEGRPEEARAAWWAAYLGGGVWEAHVLPPYDRPMSAWEKTWNELGGARAFLESLPFWEMQPHNDLVKSGHALCLARPGAAYALYLPEGGKAEIELEGGEYTIAWWNPANSRDGRFQDRRTLGGGLQELTAPGPGDWAVKIVKGDKGQDHELQGAKQAYYPPPESAGGWRKLEDRQQIKSVAGMDPAKLDELKQWLLASDKRDFAAVVVRRGYVVLEVERGNSAKTDARRVASVSKAVCATVLAIASEQSQQGKRRKTMTFDDRAFDFLPQAQPLSDERKSQITVKQLLNHTSGITPEATGARNEGPWRHVLGHDGDPLTAKLAFDPGTKCGYSTFALYHASLVCENVTGKPYDQFAIEALLRPIGVEHWTFEFFEGGGDDGERRYGRHPSHSLGMPARDLARLAYCMLRGGCWEDRQVIPRWFVDETAEATHDVKEPELRFQQAAQSFSHGWELPARLEGGRGEGIPADARYKPGSGGQLMAFVPSLDLVIARQTGSSGSWEYEEFLRLACEAVVKD